jgi:hypothetical protein
VADIRSGLSLTLPQGTKKKLQDFYIAKNVSWHFNFNVKSSSIPSNYTVDAIDEKFDVKKSGNGKIEVTVMLVELMVTVTECHVALENYASGTATCGANYQVLRMYK